ncbi:Hypothetical predicted protein, partial [Pelobates cultripes]
RRILAMWDSGPPKWRTHLIQLCETNTSLPGQTLTRMRETDQHNLRKILGQTTDMPADHWA